MERSISWSPDQDVAETDLPTLLSKMSIFTKTPQVMEQSHLSHCSSAPDLASQREWCNGQNTTQRHSPHKELFSQTTPVVILDASKTLVGAKILGHAEACDLPCDAVDSEVSQPLDTIHKKVRGGISSATEIPKTFRQDTVNSICAEVEEIKESSPSNRFAKYFDAEYFKRLDDEKKELFFKCVCTGIDNPDSALGCYAMKPDDYTTFKPFFDKVLGDYHKDDPNCAECHVNDWETGDDRFDLRELGIDHELSMRIRVGRNLSDFNLPGAMDKDERVRFELAMLKYFEVVKSKYGGTVYSITPKNEPAFGRGGNPNYISDEKYTELVAAHVMFKDMNADPYLRSAGISSDWPYGRGCWQSQDNTKIIWFGEEDHLRIMCMKKGFLLNEVFDGLRELLDCIESIPKITFAKDVRFGYVTSCPSNLGTAMRASVHIRLPKLTSDGTDKKVKEIVGSLGLSVRGVGGEHTPIGADGTVDISPRARLFIKENEILGKLMEGLTQLLAAEKAAGMQNLGTKAGPDATDAQDLQAASAYTWQGKGLALFPPGAGPSKRKGGRRRRGQNVSAIPDPASH